MSRIADMLIKELSIRGRVSPCAELDISRAKFVITKKVGVINDTKLDHSFVLDGVCVHPHKLHEYLCDHYPADDRDDNPRPWYFYRNRLHSLGKVCLILEPADLRS